MIDWTEDGEMSMGVVLEEIDTILAAFGEIDECEEIDTTVLGELLNFCARFTTAGCCEDITGVL